MFFPVPFRFFSTLRNKTKKMSLSSMRVGVSYSANFEESEPVSVPVGIKEMLSFQENQTIRLKGSDKNLVVITGSGWHILNALKALCVMEDKSGDVPLVTLSQTIESVSNATSVTIRKNPLDKEEQTYKEALAKAEDEAAATAAKECLAEVEKKRAEQLAEEKAKTILWLESLSDDLDHTMVVAVRNLCTLDGQMRKPVWCTGLSGGEEYVWDIGSGKIVLVSTKTGCQFGDYLEFDFDELTKEKIKELVEKMLDSQGTQGMTKVPAFATGKWRGDEAQFGILQKVMTEAGLTCELLTPEKEAFFGSRSTLGLMFPYFPQARNILTIELGGGSTQYMFFKRQQ